MSEKVSVAVPDILEGKLDISSVYQNYSASGKPTSFGVDLRFAAMSLHRDIKSKDFHLLQPKVEQTLDGWARKYERHLASEHKRSRAETVDALNAEAKAGMETLASLLEYTLSVDDTVDWDSLKRKDAFRTKPEMLLGRKGGLDVLIFNSYGRPAGVVAVDPPREPTFDVVKAEYGFWSRVFRRSRMAADFENRVASWKRAMSDVEAERVSREQSLEAATASFDAAKATFEAEKQRENEAIDVLRTRHAEKDVSAVEEYCEMVLGASAYPDSFPQSWVLEYRSEGPLLVVDYDLPAPGKLQTVESYKYVKARDEVSEKTLSVAAQKKLYESVIYQVCIRTIHELFEADTVGALAVVVFNGCVSDISPATGVLEHKTILSVSASKKDFEAFDLAKVNPKATFKHLKGVSGAALADLVAVPPVVMLDRADKRFVEGKVVAAHLDESKNLAAMDWEDFEHLVRELFEQEFAMGGGEVRVTRSSSDGGVDAVAFDPDPIRGGKIVIQAKRYTNTVGVAAVRDLYGTVMSEGATKGILVTTSDYGKDSYDFVKGKPLTLLNGSNLLSLLEKHGHRARINVAEAKNAARLS